MPDPPDPSSHDADAAEPADGASDAAAGASAVALEGGAPRQLAGRLAGLSLRRQIFVLAIWPLLQQFLNWLVSSVDTAVAGRQESEDAANAIAVAGYLNWFMGIMVMGIGAGGAALIARAIGRGHRGLANAGVGQTLLMGMVGGGIVGLAVIAVADVLGAAAGLSGESLAMSSVYLRIIAAFTPVAAILFVSGHCLTAAGDTKAPFFVMVAMNAVNLVATVTLAGVTLTFGGEPTQVDGETVMRNTETLTVGLGWGVVGIAWGTCIGWTVGAILMAVLLTRKNAAVRLHPHRLKPHRHTLQRIWRVAYPNLLDRGGHWLGNWIIIMIVGYIGMTTAIGDDVQGAHIIAIRIEAISFLPALAFAAAAGTLTGQYLGANDPEMARRAARQCWLTGAGIMALIGLVFIAIPEPLVALYTDKDVFLEHSPPLVRLCGFVQFFFASAIIFQGAMRGAGDTRVPAILSNSLTWGFRLPLAIVFGLLLGWGLYGIWVALCTELFVRGCVFIARYKGSGWLKVKV